MPKPLLPNSRPLYNSPALIEARDILQQRGYAVIPLGLDARGKPKRPLPAGWQKTTPRTLHEWRGALGLGIVLGEASGNLAAIDIDDNALARSMFVLLVRSHVKTRMVWTTSRNLHVYVQEAKPSASTAFRVSWQGRSVGIELKAQGTQVAAPPTSGYVLCDREGWLPLAVPSIGAAWGSIATKLGIAPTGEIVAINYPKPWQETVPKGERNKAVYVEACRLREAGMPLEAALTYISIRWEQAYAQGDASPRETEGTVRSAYRHGAIRDTGGAASRWADGFMKSIS